MRLEPIQIAPGPERPATESVEVQVVVDAQGAARLEEPREQGALRSAIEAALARSEFRPAREGAVPVAARVRLSLPVAALPGAAPELQPSDASDPAAPPATTQFAAPASALAAPTPEQTARAADGEPGEPATYGATGRVSLPAPNVLHLEKSEMRDLPGAFGDPFRVLDALPGVVPVLSGLPYVYVRGAPPAGTLYYYDGIQVPALFHLALGPAVIHPALIGAVDFYPSVAPARYGRYTGGVLVGGARDRGTPSVIGGEVELRLIDVMGMVEAPLAGGSLAVAARYGYPGLVLGLFSPDALLAYWDYQTRVTLPLNEHDRFEFTWFGSFDRAGSKDSQGDESTITLEFHRAEARLIRQLGNFEFGSAVQLGYERSEIEAGLRVHSARIGPRIYAAWRGSHGLRLRLGADVFGTVGELTAPQNQDRANIEINVPLYADVAGRSISGAYGELSLPLHRKLLLDLGLRGDVWLTGSRSETAADPRVTLTWHAADHVDLHVAGGLGHQPAVFLVPLPGIADVGLEHGLQRAVQSEAGVAIDLPAKLRLESQVYLQYLTNMIFPDLALDQSEDCDTLPFGVAGMTERCEGYPRASAWAYGLEVFMHRSPSEKLSGWLSYTLGWAKAHAERGFSFTPSFDVRHVLNLVLQYRIGGGWSAGTRLHYRTGKMASWTFVRADEIRYEQRLPGFFRADLQLSYGWQTSWGKMRLALEWFNVTLAREATDIKCVERVKGERNPLNMTPCEVTLAPALFFPNLGLRTEF